MAQALPLPQCRECERVRRSRLSHLERRQMKRAARWARREAFRLRCGDALAGLRHSMHPRSDFRRDVRLWMVRILVWWVQGLIYALAAAAVIFILAL